MTQPLAIVTGASRGIGYAIATQLAASDYEVIGLCKDSDSLAQDQQPPFKLLLCDVGDVHQVQNLFETIANKDKNLSVLVNNAAVSLESSVVDMEIDDWDKTIATNLNGVFYCCKYAIPLMQQASNPNIINISSRIGTDEYAEALFSAYGATKAAVNNFTLALSSELVNTPIRVNAVFPALTKTDLFDAIFTEDDAKKYQQMNILGTPGEVAQIVMGIINDSEIRGQIVRDPRLSKRPY